ncbi:FAD-dependent oxidoreductase [Roseimaritima sediminicola]|uniref:FAD-dependent oxidoreductase n=1 Tax=Roseimaritima sediminicola TaxID=2662066 RepID=UPI0021BCF27A|nr:FAD-dependent oxidoreductase [Roseimaritima sediminicola]
MHADGSGARRRIHAATFRGPDDRVLSVTGGVFIDGSYEGDLMAEAGVAWTVGREARQTCGESLAPEQADDQLQAYNFRFIMTRDPENRVTPVAPPGYRREDFVGVLDALESGQIRRVFDYPSRCIFKAHLPVLPGGKYDINDVSRGPVRLSLPGVNRGWPAGDHRQRQEIFAEHLRDQVGLLYFLQNDPAVPARFRQEAAQWGWCRDEFVDSDHLPPQLYVREARGGASAGRPRADARPVHSRRSRSRQILSRVIHRARGILVAVWAIAPVPEHQSNSFSPLSPESWRAQASQDSGERGRG